MHTGTRTFLPIAAAVTLSLYATTTAVNAAPQSKSEADRPWLIRLINANEATVHEILRKPDAEDPTSFTKKGFSEIYASMRPDGKTGLVLLDFEKDPGSWQMALKLCGVKSTTGLKGNKRTWKQQTLYDITGFKGLPKEWQITYSIPYRY